MFRVCATAILIHIGIITGRQCPPPSIPPLTFVHHTSSGEFSYACPSGFVLSGYPHRVCNRTIGRWQPEDVLVACYSDLMLQSDRFALDGDHLRPLPTAITASAVCSERTLVEVVHLRVPAIVHGFVFTAGRQYDQDEDDGDGDDDDGGIMEVLLANDTSQQSDWQFCDLHNLLTASGEHHCHTRSIARLVVLRFDSATTRRLYCKGRMQLFAKFDSIQCTSNRQQFYVAGICYSLTSFHLNFSSAVDYCHRHSGQLAAPTSNNQRSALIDRLIDLYPMTSSLLGVSIIRQSIDDTSSNVTYSSIDDESINCNMTTAACQWPRCAAANTRARRWSWTACNTIPLWICSYNVSKCLPPQLDQFNTSITQPIPIGYDSLNTNLNIFLGETVWMLCLHNASIRVAIVCRPDGTWTPVDDRQCRHNSHIVTTTTTSTVSNRSCPSVMPPEHGSVLLSTTSQHLVAEYRCESGYRLIGTSKRICRIESWSGHMPKCLSVPCIRPSSIANGRYLLSSDPIRIGTRVLYSCIEGYTLDGASDAVMVCESTAQWNSTVWPTCRQIVVSCPPISVANGYVDYLDDQSLHVGSRIAIRCNIGYRIDGESSIVHCSQSGTWDYDNATFCRPTTSFHSYGTTIADKITINLFDNITLIVIVTLVLISAILCVAIWAQARRKKIDRVSDASTTTTPSMPTIAYESTLEPSIMFDDYSQYHHQHRPRISTDDDDEDGTDQQQSNEMYRHDYYYRNPPVDRHYQSCVAAGDVITVSDDADQDDRHGTFDRKNSLPTSLNVAIDESSSSFRRSHSYTSDSSRLRTMMMMRDDQHILPWNQSVFDTRYETKRVWPHQRVTPRTIKKRRKQRGGDEDMNQLPSPMMIPKKVQFSDDLENTPV